MWHTNPRRDDALDDPDGVEQGGRMDGMGLLPCATRFTGQKVRTRVQAFVESIEIKKIQGGDK